VNREKEKSMEEVVMLPRRRVSMQPAARPGWFGMVFIVTAAAWASCSSPEAFHNQTNLVNGSAGSGGAPGAAGMVTSSGSGGTAVNGAAGDAGGAAGDGALAGTTGSAAGTGAAGTGAAGTVAAEAGTSGTSAAGSGAAGAGDAGTGAAGTVPPQTTLSLPMTLSDHFVMSGGMGDAAIAGSIVATTNATACNGEPAAAKVGACFSITYQPQPLAGRPSTWAGFFWQYPANNWGGTQPQLIASGAKAVSFYAKGVAGGERLTFKAGGIVNMPSVTTPFSDSFTVTNNFILTTTWTKYTLPMAGVTYGSGVLGAFAWVAEAPNTNPVRFLIHGIVWE
jgi:hypothetical protein